MNYFGLPSTLLPASLHDWSRQLQEPSIAKIHWLNGTTVPPDMPDPQPSDDARCWYKLVMCRQGWLLTSFSCLDSKYHHLHCTKPRTVMTGLSPLSLHMQPSLKQDSWFVQTLLDAAGTTLREGASIVIRQ